MKKLLRKLTAVLSASAMILGAVPSFSYAAERTVDDILSSDGAFVLNFDDKLPAGVKSEGNLEYVEGVSGQAAKFDGNGTYLVLPDDLNAGVTDFTLGMWVRFDAVTPDVWQRVIDIHGEGHRSMYFGIWQYLGSNNIRFGIEDDEGEEQASYFGAFSVGEWVNYTITQSGSVRTLYVNGREVATSGATNTANDLGATAYNYIGHTVADGVPVQDFNGAVDEFFFVKEAMTADQVLELAIRNMNDSQAADAHASLTYLNFNGNEAENMFDYYYFNDGSRYITWSSSRPDVLTVDGLTEGASVGELTEVVLTATVTAGSETRTLNYTYVVTPELVVENMSLEDVEKKSLRQNSSVNYDITKTYLLKKKSTGEYLTQNGDALALTTDASDPNAKWRLANSSAKNTYSIFNIADGLCLNVRDYGNTAGTDVLLYRGGKGMNENWYFVDLGDGVGIYSYGGNHFFNASAEGFTIESLYDADQWELVETDRGTLPIGSIVDDESVSVSYETMEENVYYTLKRSGAYMSTNENNGNLTVSGYNGDNSLWYFTQIASGCYTITNKAAEKNLNISGNSTDVGANVITWDKGTAQNEQWCFTKVDGGYTIVGAANKNYLCGYGGSFRMDASPQVWTIEVAGTASAEGGKSVSPLVTDYCPEISEVVDSATGLIHPGISLNAEDIRRIQKHVRAGDEPWASAFTQLAGSANASLNPRIYAWDSDGDTTKLVVETRLKNLRNDATTAANQALMYVITGNEAYRTNSINIVRKWSELRDVYAELGSDRIDHGVIAYKLSFAAELLKYSSCQSSELVWTSADNAMFVGMLETINSKHNRFWHWMNQHGICNTGTMASAIFRNDIEQYKIAVERTTVNAQGGGESAVAGGAIIQVFKLMTRDEFLDEELDEPIIEHVEMGRDMGHAYDNNAALSTCAMMSLKQNTLVDPVTGELTTAENGVNIFEFADHRLLAGTNIVSMYNLGIDVPFTATDVGGYYYTDVNDTNRGNLYNAIGQVYCYYKYIAKADMDADNIKYVTRAYEARFPEPPAADDLGMATLLYTGDDGIIDTMPIQDTSTANTWQSEFFTAVNYGTVEAVTDEDGTSYAKVSLEDGGSRFAHTTTYYAPGEQNKVILRVRTHGEVKVTIQNESLMYAPFVEAIIPDTMGEWETVEFTRQPEAAINQRIMFFTFEGDGGELDIDYMKFTN